MTEFIPVSSTGHLLLLGHFLGFESAGKAFEVLIQLGAVLAILVVYFPALLEDRPRAAVEPPGAQLRHRHRARLPAGGVRRRALHGIIKTVLFESPALICIMLVTGGLVLLVVDRIPLKARYQSAYDFPPRLAFGIGICQMVALIPGVSRSGATIVGALLLGAEKRAAAEFSFFLALPTMAGAFAYDLYKNFDRIDPNEAVTIAVGLVAAFLAALFVVRRLLDFVARSGFAPFAWWRIGVGLAGLVGTVDDGCAGAARLRPGRIAGRRRRPPRHHHDREDEGPGRPADQRGSPAGGGPCRRTDARRDRGLTRGAGRSGAPAGRSARPGRLREPLLGDATALRFAGRDARGRPQAERRSANWPCTRYCAR